jgi:hypothetical protein
MDVLRRFLALGAVPLLAGAAAAQTAGRQDPQTVVPSATVSGVTVTAHTPSMAELVVQARKVCFVPPQAGESPLAPEVVDIYPKPGETAPSGLMFVRITFDQPMSRCSYSVTTMPKLPFPDQLKIRPRVTADLKTFLLPVWTQPNQDYLLTVNGPPFVFFKNIFGQAAKSRPVLFKTSDSVARSEQEAASGDPQLGVLLARADAPLIDLPEPTLGKSH